jgi:hypothetical protein
VTPEELYSGNKFDLETLHIFGQFGHSLEQKPPTKFAARGSPCVYLRIQQNSSLHQLFLLENHTLVFRRDSRPWSHHPAYVNEHYWSKYYNPRGDKTKTALDPDF